MLSRPNENGGFTNKIYRYKITYFYLRYDFGLTTI